MDLCTLSAAGPPPVYHEYLYENSAELHGYPVTCSVR
jgi:hypothetical protein